MRPLAFALILLTGPGALLADGRTELDILRARCNEQERQIRTLEKEIESLHSQLALERRRSRGVEPSAAPASPLPPAPQPTYTVRTGDTLSSIARRYDTSAEVLMKSNGIEDPTRLRVGQKLALPADAKVPEAVPVKQPAPQPAVVEKKPETAPVAKATGSYTVQRGDTLYGIARQHQIRVSELKALNPKIADKNKIMVGQSLAVRGTPAPSLGSSGTRTIANPAPKPTPKPSPKPAAKPKPAPASEKPSAAPEKPAPEPAEEPASAPAPKSISSVIVMDEVSLGALAAKHGTTTEELNSLNNWNYKSDLLLARGSEVYVPAR